MVDVWSRAGAISGRGFHYQDAVGAWFSVMLLEGKVRGGRLVPEGFEDLHIEGEDPIYVQVKSRQEKRGSFSIADTLAFLDEMWGKHLARTRAGETPGRLMLVQERAVAGESFSDYDAVLGELPDSHHLVTGVRRRLPLRDAESLLSRTTLITLDWQEAQDAAVNAIMAATGTIRATAEVAERWLRIDVADAADRNANARDAAAAASINRTSVRNRIDEVLRLTDRDALQRALAEGVCVPVRFTTEAANNDYYLGASARPSHISAGLPAPMPAVVGRAVESMNDGKPVLLSGPSGVGKSTAMWSAVYTRRDVIWYQIKRTSPDAIGAIVDLLHAMGSSARNQIGLVIDGAGSGENFDWDGLREATSHLEGTMMLGSVRHEDLINIQNRADCSVIEVKLTEEIASSLYENLRQRNLTEAAHWREAFNESHGLTMEFTYLLTRGQRLRDVLYDQVLTRVREGRETELRVLSLSATASRWGLAVPISALSTVVEDPASLRGALARLVEEHLVQIAGGEVDGLHALRSSFLSEAVHATPPPSADATVSTLIALLPETALPSLFVGISRDMPETLPSAVDALVRRILDGRTSELLAGLRAVRFVDLERRAARWIDVLDRHDVAAPKRLFAIQFAMIDSDLTGLPLPASISAAVSELREIAREPFTELSNLVRSFGVDGLAIAVFDARTVGEVTELLAASQGLDADTLVGLDEALRRLAASDRPLRALHPEPDLDSLAELLLAARSLDLSVADVLLQAFGGVIAMIDRLTNHFPWAIEIAVVNEPENPVFLGRLLHISDELQGDAHTNAKELARLGIACLPACRSADIATLSTDGLPYDIGGLEMGVSTLQRRSLHARSSVSFNRQTGNFAAARIFDITLTERLTIGHAGIVLADALVEKLARHWLCGESRKGEHELLHRMRVELDELASQLVPVSNTPLSADQVPMSDDLHTLLAGIAIDVPSRLAKPEGYRALAMYIVETLVKAAQRSTEEAWELIDREPLELIRRITAKLESLAAVIEEVAVGGTDPRDLRRAARSGESTSALTRAADLATRNAIRRSNGAQEHRLRELQRMGLSAISFHRSTGRVADGWPPQQYAIGVEVANVVEWLTTAETLASMLSPGSNEQGYQPPLEVFALIEGRRVNGYGMTIIRSAHPRVESLGDWGSGFPAVWDTPRSEAFKLANHALIVLSGLGALRRYRSDASLEEVAETAKLQLSGARELLNAYEDDVTENLVTYLDTATAGVMNETRLSHDLDQTQTYAGQMMGLFRGLQTQVGRDSIIYGNLAIQADIDLDTARSLVV
ncbi:hypothetical protein Q9S36_10700 [Microbacterium sp. ARD31]|uniref:hypothetical protein n=1 Tax=Microbacterium sp. ARD31 TaxID=2962576 RepID=UPI00288134D0|nr:hypothetical protein [Microbacterium sp. ARD31]MDT0180665.1 hypothetical protein [Microbacterium sp. ARD31]